MTHLYKVYAPKFLNNFDKYLLRNYPVVWRTQILFMLVYSIVCAPLLYLWYDSYYSFLLLGICYWAYRQHEMDLPFTTIKDTLLTLLLYSLYFSLLLWFTRFDSRYWTNPNDWTMLFSYPIMCSLILYFIPLFPFKYWSVLVIILCWLYFIVTDEQIKMELGFSFLLIPLLFIMRISISAYKKIYPKFLILFVSVLFINILSVSLIEISIKSYDPIFYIVQVLGVIGAILTTYVRALPKR